MFIHWNKKKKKKKESIWFDHDSQRSAEYEADPFFFFSSFKGGSCDFG